MKAEARKKAERFGLSRWFAYQELAALASVTNHVDHVYAMAKIFEAEESSLHRACRSLNLGGLLSAQSQIVDGRAREVFSLTTNGRKIFDAIRDEKDFIRFDFWVKRQISGPGHP